MHCSTFSNSSGLSSLPVAIPSFNVYNKNVFRHCQISFGGDLARDYSRLYNSMGGTLKAFALAFNFLIFTLTLSSLRAENFFYLVQWILSIADTH